MPKFIIEPHFRLQEWVAEEKGYFRDEGLDYEFRELIRSSGGAHHVTKGKAGAFQSIEKGREANVTCACHWTVNVAASRGHTKLYADAYSVAPSAIFVPANSKVKTPADLADVPISVGYQSGSHYATIQALEQYMPADRIKLSFDEGMLFNRMERFLDGKSQAAALFSGPYYFAEQLGFRKIIDNTFMISAMLNGNPEPEDIASILPCTAAGAARHRRAAGALHALLQERIPRALPRAHGHPVVGARRAHRLRAVHQGGLRAVVCLDRQTRAVRAGQDGFGPIRGRSRHDPRPVGAGRAAPNTLPLGSELL